MKTYYRRLVLILLSFLLSCQEDYKPSDQAKLLAVKVKNIPNLTFSLKQKTFNAKVAYEQQNLLDKPLQISLDVSEKATVTVAGQVVKNLKEVTVTLKKQNAQYRLENPIYVLSEDCLVSEAYYLQFEGLDKAFAFTPFEKIFLNNFDITSTDIFNNVVGDKKDYHLTAISDINPSDIAALTGAPPNLSLKVLKKGEFTATLTYQSTQKQPQVTIKQALFKSIPFEKPEIDGTPLVGNSLSITNLPAVSNAWQTHIRWYRDGKLISGATTSSYTLQIQDLHKDIHVQITLQKGKEQYTRSSLPIENIINHPPKPIISGYQYQGETLTYSNVPSNIKGWTQSIKWYQENSSNTFSSIPAATNSQYTLTASNLNKRIKVSIELTYTATGGKTKEVFSDATSAINSPVPTPAAPTIQGTPIVNENLTAVTSAVPAGWTLLIQWVYKGDTNTVLATGRKYALTSKDVNKQLIAKIRYTKGILLGRAVLSNAYEVVINHPSPPTFSSPTFNGRYLEKRVLNAYFSSTPAGWTRVIKWYRVPVTGASTPVEIKNATSPSRLLARSDVNHTLQVSVQFTKGSWKTDAVKSGITEVIPMPAPPTISGCEVVGDDLTAKVETPPTNWLSEVRWYADGVFVPSFSYGIYNISRSDFHPKRKVITMKVIYVKGSLRSPIVDAVSPTGPVFDLVNTPPKPVLTGGFAVGNTLTFVPPVPPANWILNILWFVDGRYVTGNATNRFVITANEKGKKIRVRITYSRTCKEISTYSDLSPIIP